jgi:putative phosphonate catabolism associated alcohol dehydrogenase
MGGQKFGRAIVFHGSGLPLEERQYPLPEALAPGSLLLRTRMATVCGSDVNTWLGKRPFPTPSILGHEIVGSIAALGEGVHSDTAGNAVSAGDRIVFSILSSCGVCRNCRMKRLPQKCSSLFKYGHARSDIPPHFTGGFAEYVVLRPGTCFFKVPDGIEDREAAPLMCAGATAYAGLEAIGLDPGERVCVQGFGMLGLYAAALAKSRGAGLVLGIDRNENRLRSAKRFGVDHCISTAARDEGETLEAVRDLTGGLGVDLVIEASGDPAVIPSGLKMLDNGGRYLLLGALYPGSSCSVDSHELIGKCLILRGLHNYDPRYLGLVLQFMSRERSAYPFGELVGPSWPLSAEGLGEAFAALQKGDSVRPAIVP